MAAADARIRAYTPTLRAIVAALEALSIVNLVALAVSLALDTFAAADAERAPLPLLVRRTFELSVVPWLLARVFRALCAANVDRDAIQLTVNARWGSLQVPAQAASAPRRWLLPLPEPGFTIAFPSGAVGFSWNASGKVGGPAFPDASAGERLRTLHRAWLKLGAVPAVVTFILFRLHQRIAFGDLFGEALLFGWHRWVRTLVGVALSVFCTLLAIATALRAGVEIVALGTARLPPRWAARARMALEIAAALLYYGGIAAVLVLRLGF